MTNPFSKYFQSEPEEATADLTDCYQLVEFGKTMYFPKLIAYLERGADEPLRIGEPMAMIQSAARVNTFKEIKAHLKRQVREAQEIIDRETTNG